MRQESRRSRESGQESCYTPDIGLFSWNCLRNAKRPVVATQKPETAETCGADGGSKRKTHGSETERT